MDAAGPPVSIDLAGFEEKEGLPVEAFAKVQEIFSNVDWLDPNADAALTFFNKSQRLIFFRKVWRLFLFSLLKQVARCKIQVMKN